MKVVLVICFVIVQFILVLNLLLLKFNTIVVQSKQQQ